MSQSKPAPALTECSYHTRKIPHAHIQAERVLVQTCSLDTGTRLSCEHTQALAGTRVRTNWTVEILTSAFVTLLVETPEKQIPRQDECEEALGVPVPTPTPPPVGTASPHQTKSLHTEQKVGCLKKVAINSWFLM